jgi:hypothetical protein
LATRPHTLIPGCVSHIPDKDYHGLVFLTLSKTAAAHPTGDNIALEGTGDIQDGVDIYLSPEIQENIKNIVKSDCDKELNSKCYNEVQDLFDKPETGLMARNPVFIGLSIVGGLGAVLFPAIYKETQPSVIHVPMRELNQATEIPEATQIIVEPEHGSFITIDPSPQPTATGYVSNFALICRKTMELI